MIGTIRKHSKWLWWSIIPLTIFSFVIFMGSGPAQNGGGGSGDFGSINGKKITQAAYVAANSEMRLFFLFRYGQWPEKMPNVTADSLERETYVRLFLIQKTDNLGIHISDEAVAAMANQMLHSAELAHALGINSDSIPLDVFQDRILKSAGLTMADFERFVRHDLGFQQLEQAVGLAGQLITPQEATAIYRREHQELSAQIVFFSASNYLSQVAATPAAVGQFYTNYLAAYRLPDRVQVSYVAFEMSNYIAAAELKLGKTNVEKQVEEIFRQNGMAAVPGAKTPEEAKSKIHEFFIHKQALEDAHQQANDFATALFAVEPSKPENLTTVAKQKGLTVQTTTPFDTQYGPEEFLAPAAFTKAAFELTPDLPLAGPIPSPTAFYVIAFDKQLPSEIPSFGKIRDRVTQDFRHEQSLQLARNVGTNFTVQLAIGMATGKSFASICVAAGLKPEVLPPFSLSTQELPEVGERADLSLVKQAAFSTETGRASGFEPTADGGFVVLPQSQLPLDGTKMNAELPQFLAQIRRARQGEFFSQWLNSEANRSLQDTPVFRRLNASRTAGSTPVSAK